MKFIEQHIYEKNNYVLYDLKVSFNVGATSG